MTEPEGFFERPGVIRAIQLALAAACAAVLLADLGPFRHGHLPIEELPGFFAAVGFLAYLGIVTAAKGLRAAVQRPEDYYGD